MSRWVDFYYSGSPHTITVIEEKPLVHPPGFVPLREAPEPQQPRPSCRIRKVTLK